MSNQATYSEVLFPIRVDKPLKDEIQRMAEALNISKSELVRLSIKTSLKKEPSQLETIWRKMREESDAWYENRKAENHG